MIARPDEVTAVYYTGDYKYEENKFLQAAARIFDQQCQLLDGTLPIDLGLVSDPKEDGSIFELNESELAELGEFYKKYINKCAQAAYINVEETEQKAYKKLRLSEDVINGRAFVIDNDGAAARNRAERRANEKIAKKIKKASNKHNKEH